MTSRGFRLDGGAETLVFLRSAVGAPELAYWGPQLERPDAIDCLAALSDTVIPPGGLDEGEKLTWTPSAGEGFLGHPAVLGHRGGHELICQFVIAREQISGSRASIDLADDASGVGLKIDLTLDGESGVLCSRTTLANQGASDLTLEWLAAGALPTIHGQVITFNGRWAREMTPVSQTLVTGLLAKENRSGRTSHVSPPFLLVGEPGFSENRGELFAAHLAWSGDHRLFVERLRDGRIQVQAGELLRPGEVVLKPGESYASPKLFLARSAAGLNGVSDRLHPFVRRMILGRRLEGKPRPVHYNTWEAIYFDHDPARLRTLADQAAAIGVERFVLDDGWFCGRVNDRAGLGDWTPDVVKYPDGLGPLIDHVRALGMEFGLWVEPEMANVDSDLLRAHPDWVLGAPSRAQPLGRGQFVLDLTRGEVAEAIFAQLDALLAAHAIGYLKWDMNRDLTHAVSAGRAAIHRQVKAVYALIDRLRAAHPGVEIESCASGGGRADYEILRRCERIWTSDCNDPIERQQIQRAFSIFFPPEVMGAHVGPRSSHTTARASSMRLRAMTALAGHLGVEADLTELSEPERAELAKAIAFYKTHRGWMHAARTARLEHPDPGCVATALIAANHALVSVAQVATAPFATPAPVRVTGLPGAEVWRVEPLHAPARARRTQRDTAFLSRGETRRATGAMLEHAGLPLPILHAGQIAVFLLTRER